MLKLHQIVIAAALVLGCDTETDDDDIDVEFRVEYPEDEQPGNSDVPAECYEAIEDALNGYVEALENGDRVAANQYKGVLNELKAWCFPWSQD